MARFFAACGALLLAQLGAVPRLFAQDSVRIVVVSTTDIHGRATRWDYVADREAPWGVDRAGSVVDSLRRQYPGRVIVVDAGDLIQGDPFATYFARIDPADPHPVLDALNAVGYDAWTPGNHEFNFGLDVLARATRSAAFATVSGNIFRLPRDTLLFPAYTVVVRDSVRVGIAGFTTPGVMVWDRQNVSDRVRVRP
ncbi:MAG: metallophosphoesterase, partial [Gemmatimonadetes bacterium]|nr:metallophosphoesterase [Gemmatimonadota bacterium]